MTIDRGHGSPYDRGRADSYYGRPFRPHWYPNGTGNQPLITDLTQEQLDDYHRGFSDNTREGNFKDWGGDE
jgi:hypothetical protein